MTETLNIIVSGGSRGLGQAITEHLLACGHRVATFSRKPTSFIERATDEFADRFIFRSGDARDADTLQQFVDSVARQWQRIDGLINNAGIAHDGVLATQPNADIDRMLDINLRGSLVLARECARHMLVQRAGSIINISSIIAQRGFAGLAAYAATKAGQEGMTRALAREMGSRGIRVNAIAPGYLDTEMSEGLEAAQRDQIIRRTPLGRLGTAADVTPIVEFLLSDASRFVTGQVITVDGGATV